MTHAEPATEDRNDLFAERDLNAGRWVDEDGNKVQALRRRNPRTMFLTREVIWPPREK